MFSANTVNPYRSAANFVPIAACVGSPRSRTSRTPSAVLATCS